MQDRALSFDPEQVAPLARPRRRGARLRPRGSRRRRRRPRFPSRRSRSRSAPSGRRPTSGPRLRASRSSSQVAVIFPIAQSEPTVRTIVASTSRFAPVAVLRSGGRLAQVAQLDAVLRGELGELRGSSCRRTCRPFSRSRPFDDAALQQLRQSPGKRPPCVTTPTSAVFGLKQSASSTRADDRDAVLDLPGTLRVEDRDDAIAPVAHDARARLRRSAGRARTLQRGSGIASRSRAQPYCRPPRAAPPRRGRSGARSPCRPSRRPRRCCPSTRAASTTCRRRATCRRAGALDSTRSSALRTCAGRRDRRCAERDAGRRARRSASTAGSGALRTRRVRRLARAVRLEDLVREQELGGRSRGGIELRVFHGARVRARPSVGPHVSLKDECDAARGAGRSSSRRPATASRRATRRAICEPLVRRGRARQQA